MQKDNVICDMLLYLHYPNQFILYSKKSYLLIHNAYIHEYICTFNHIIVAAVKHTRHKTKLIDPTVLLHAAIFCEVSAKPNYQTTKEMNMIEQERKKNT